MRIVIATPLYPPDVGGPAKYAKAMHEHWADAGHKIDVIAYGPLERALPSGLRHLLYFIRTLPHAVRADVVFALDTWSVGLPALIAARITGARFAVRIGGDALWEEYVFRTRALVKLSAFYAIKRKFTFKEKLMYRCTRYLLRHAHLLIYNTTWQRDLWESEYAIPRDRTKIVENVLPEQRVSDSKAERKVFVAAGRDHPLKNQEMLERVFARVQEEMPSIALDTRQLPPDEHASRIARAYAVVIASISEVSPNTAADALAHGVPFIATTDSGASQVLRSAGIYIDMTDDKALEQAIRALLSPEGYQKALARVRTPYSARSWETVSREMLDAIKSIAR